MEERIRSIQVLRDIAGGAAPTDEELMRISMEELAIAERELQKRLRERR